MLDNSDPQDSRLWYLVWGGVQLAFLEATGLAIVLVVFLGNPSKVHHFLIARSATRRFLFRWSPE